MDDPIGLNGPGLPSGVGGNFGEASYRVDDPSEGLFHHDPNGTLLNAAGTIAAQSFASSP
jgi:hypothetical protein